MSDKWHKDHKKAIAEKWTQCPPVTTKVKELIGDEVCMGTYGLVELEVMQLETKLAEARAEIERLALEIENQQYTITCASEENQQLKESLAEARAEIEKQDTLLGKCLCLLKQQKEREEL